MYRFVRSVAGICIIASTLTSAASVRAQGAQVPIFPPVPPAVGPDAGGAPPLPPAEVATGSLSGQVQRDPAAVATPLEARITGPDGSEQRVPVDAGGQFYVPALAPGSYLVTVREAEREATGSVDVVAGQDAPLLLDWAPVAPPAAAPPAKPDGDMVVIVDRMSAGQQLQQSAEAVHVVDTRKAKAQSADLGEVMARTQGIGVRREGGLGSSARVALNGLSGDQVRFFFDGVPLELAGYPFGIANVPVNLVDRVEIYRGVVPVRFGTDALGGAINLVSPEARESYLGGAYQLGSFGTHRVTVDGRYLHKPSGFTIAANAFTDLANNDYEVDVKLGNAIGQEVPTRLRRFHDAYRAYGGRLEVGVRDKPWAKRLSLTAFAFTYDKDIQNNFDMSAVYGDVTYGDSAFGGTARYDLALSPTVELGLTASYSHRIIDFRDTSVWTYDWRGERTDDSRRPGEIGEYPTDSTLWQDAVFTRALLTWEIAPEQVLRLSLSPAFTTRVGDERREREPAQRDPLSGRSKLLTFVGGLEYELNLFDERLSNVVFAKNYVYHADFEKVLHGGALDRGTTNDHSVGGGDSIRIRMAPWLYTKLSYEYAMRMPRPDELFGNGALVRPNRDLQPEISHNANVGPRVELKNTPIGDLSVDVNGFLRESDRLIVLISESGWATSKNIFKTRGLGLESALSWRSPGQWVSLDGALTWQDIRNRSTRGEFANVKGDRLLNLPYLLGSWGARLRVPNMPGKRDTLEPFYYGRYVHSFFRGWESLGRANPKQTIPTQVSHDVGVTWVVSREVSDLTLTFEVRNVADAKLYDNYGVQRPGRAYYLKLTARLP